MVWLGDQRPRAAATPRSLWPEVRSVVVLAMNYGPDSDPLANLDERDRGAISVYARNGDYHDVIKGRLKELARWRWRTPAARSRCSSIPRR